jgi:hypothetical protein
MAARREAPRAMNLSRERPANGVFNLKATRKLKKLKGLFGIQD